MSFIFWLFKIKKSKCNRPIQLASGFFFFFFFLSTMNSDATLTQQQMQIAGEIEIEMMQDLYTRYGERHHNH